MRSVSRFIGLLSATLSLAAIAHAADSVFLPGAFTGQWYIVRDDKAVDGITISPMDEASGVAAINSQGDPNFAASSCPLATEKREFYQGQTESGATFYLCTNGNSLAGRTFNGILASNGINAGPPPNVSFIITSFQEPPFQAFFSYMGGNPGTPLALAPPDDIKALFTTPAAGSTLQGGITQDFVASLDYKMSTHRQGTVQLLLTDGQQTVIAASALQNVSNTDPRQQSLFQISKIKVPDNGSLLLRAEMRLPSGAVVAAFTAATFSIVKPSIPDALTVAPLTLRFTAGFAKPGTFDQTLLLQKSGSGASVPFTAAKVGNSTWLQKISPSSGNVINGAPTAITVTVNTSGLDPGVYLDSVAITSPVGSFNIPVTLVVDAQVPLLYLSASGLHFESRQGQGSSAIQRVNISNIGDPSTSINWSAKVTAGADLLQIDPLSGISTSGNSSEINVRLASNATDKIGTSYAVIEISDPPSKNSPQLVTVVSDVTANTTSAIPTPSPAGIFFLAVQGAASPASKTITVSVSQASSVVLSASATTDDGTSWLSAKLASATASTSSPGVATISISTVGLNPGVYQGVVNFTVGDITRGSRVILVVQPSGTASTPVSLARSSTPRSATGCTSTRVILSETALSASYSTPVGWPAALFVQMFDDCGTPQPRGTVTASFSNGDAPLSLLGDQITSDYSATWQPATALAQTVVTLVGTSGTLTPGTLKITGSVTGNPQKPPSLVPSGVLNNLNPMVGAPLAPGTVVQVYGDNMATAAESVPSVPLPLQFRGLQFFVGPYEAPIYYISKTQLTVQLPFELQPNRSYPTLLVVNGAYSVPQQLDVVALQAGTVVTTDGKLITQHLDYSLVTADSPAKPNEPLTLYLVGMGATKPAVASGAISPTDPLAYTVVQPTVTIDGQNAQILFGGLTPNGVGLYQINVIVPPGAHPGNVDVVITQNGVKANASKLIVGK